LPTVCDGRSRGENLDQRTYNAITAVLFLIIAALHLLRIIFGWPAQIGGWSIPLWVSWLAIAAAGVLACLGFRQNIRHRDSVG
jgi:hypothetical protein